jgi:hypothetical protein
MVPLGQWEKGTMEILDHGPLVPWGFGAMGLWNNELWDHGALGP